MRGDAAEAVGQMVFKGIPFVLHTGIAWEHLPQELGFGSGMTCWRRLADLLETSALTLKGAGRPCIRLPGLP